MLIHQNQKFSDDLTEKFTGTVQKDFQGKTGQGIGNFVIGDWGGNSPFIYSYALNIVH